jgi:hypothetical protein
MTNVCKLCWSAAVYHLWWQRNVIRHGKPPRTEEKILQDVIWDVKNRIRGNGKTTVNVEICINWGVGLDFLY